MTPDDVGADMSLDSIRRRIQRILEKEGGEINIFHLMDQDEIESTAGHFTFVSYESGSIVVREGERISFLGILVEGRLEVSHRPTIGDKPVIIAHMEDGAHVGTIAFPGGRPAMVTVMAEEKSDLLVLTEQSFDELAERHPATAVKLLKGVIEVLTIRLESAIDRIVLFF